MGKFFGDKIIIKDMGDHYEVFPDGDKLEKEPVKAALEKHGKDAKIDDGEWILTKLPADLQHLIDSEIKRYDPSQRPVEQNMEKIGKAIEDGINSFLS